MELNWLSFAFILTVISAIYRLLYPAPIPVVSTLFLLHNHQEKMPPLSTTNKPERFIVNNA